MSDETTLLSCPWCGVDMKLHAINYPWADGDPCWTIWHEDIGEAIKRKCPMEMGGYDTREEAIAAWNTRAELGRGTCENSAKEWGEKTYYFVCSECGWNLANVGRASIELAAEMIKTCPNCGKRVSA